MKKTTKKAAAVPPAATMLQMITGYWISKMIFMAAKLGIADSLKKGQKTIDQLASATGTLPDPLHRLMRALASVGVFAETKPRTYKTTALGKTLETGGPGSMRAFAMMMVESYNVRAWDHLPNALTTGTHPFEDVHGMKVFEYLDQHPEDGRLFSESMSSISGIENPAIAEAYDFSKTNTVVDVGGALGSLIATVAKRWKNVQGILYDRPSVIERAEAGPLLQEKSLKGRITPVAGDFFRSVPEGADAYLLKYILHDWSDDECTAILANVRRAMSPKARVLVLDNVIPAGNAPSWGKLLDINMMALTTGRERTKEDFARLFAASGLKLKRIVKTACPLSIIEGVPA